MKFIQKNIFIEYNSEGIKKVSKKCKKSIPGGWSGLVSLTLFNSSLAFFISLKIQNENVC